VESRFGTRTRNFSDQLLNNTLCFRAVSFDRCEIDLRSGWRRGGLKTFHPLPGKNGKNVKCFYFTLSPLCPTRSGWVGVEQVLRAKWGEVKCFPGLNSHFCGTTHSPRQHLKCSSPYLSLRTHTIKTACTHKSKSLQLDIYVLRLRLTVTSTHIYDINFT